MADNYSARHNPDTGQNYVRLKGEPNWREVSPDEVQILQEGGVEAFVKSAGNSMAQLGLGARAIATGKDEHMEAFQDYSGAQELRSSSSPIAGFTGSVAPDVVAGLLTGGAAAAGKTGASALIRGAAAGAATDAALEGARNPENPLKGALIGGAIGAVTGGLGSGSTARNMATPQGRVGAATDELIANNQRQTAEILGRNADEAASQADGSMGAAARQGDQRTYGKSDSMTLAEADNRAMPMTPAERTYLEAMESGNIDAIRKAEQALGNDDLMRNMRIPGTGNTAGDLGFRPKDKEQWFTEQVADELGRPDLARLGSESLNEVRADAKEIFQDAFDEGNYPAAVKFASEGGESVDSLAQARQVLDTTSTPSPALNAAIERLENAAQKGGGDVYDSQALQEAFRRASSDAEAAFKAGNYDTGMSLSSVAEIMGDALEAALPDIKKLDVAKARRRWKIKKVLERTSRTTSKTETGQINPATFQNNWREMTPGYKRNYRVRDEFEKTMDTVVTLSADRANAGTTLMRGATAVAMPAALGATGVAGSGAVAGLVGN